MSLRVLSVLGGMGVVLWLFPISLKSASLSALADDIDTKTVDQQANGSNSTKQSQTVDDFAEARRMLKGTAGDPECVWVGRRVVGLLWRDDMDTAFRQLDLYDRFGCPNGHIQLTFRCLVLNGRNIDPKAADNLNGRVQACWVNPSLQVAPTRVAVPDTSPVLH